MIALESARAVDGEILVVPFGPVVPGAVQFKEQHSRATNTSGVVS